MLTGQETVDCFVVYVSLFITLCYVDSIVCESLRKFLIYNIKLSMLTFLRTLKYTIYYYILGTLGILEDIFNRKYNKCGKQTIP